LDNAGGFAYLGSPYNTQIWKISVKDLDVGGRKYAEITLG